MSGRTCGKLGSGRGAVSTRRPKTVSRISSDRRRRLQRRHRRRGRSGRTGGFSGNYVLNAHVAKPSEGRRARRALAHNASGLTGGIGSGKSAVAAFLWISARTSSTPTNWRAKRSPGRRVADAWPAAVRDGSRPRRDGGHRSPTPRTRTSQRNRASARTPTGGDAQSGGPPLGRASFRLKRVTTRRSTGRSWSRPVVASCVAARQDRRAARARAWRADRAGQSLRPSDVRHRERRRPRTLAAENARVYEALAK